MKHLSHFTLIELGNDSRLYGLSEKVRQIIRLFSDYFILFV